MENAWLNEKPPEDGGSRKPNNHQMEQSDSSASSMDETSQSHTMIVERDSSEAGAVDTKIDANEVRAMSPRRNRDDIEALGKEAREELRRHAKALQESLIALFNRIEAVREEHDKLENNNKFLQKYIGDLMSTSKITATSSSRGKK